MRTRLRTALVALAFGIATGTSTQANAKACAGGWPQPFAHGKPYLLNDPRTGLTLDVKSDGRHMAAITRDGKILWHKNLFADPRLELDFPPPPSTPGWPEPTSKAWFRYIRLRLRHLTIDGIGVLPDCALNEIERGYPGPFHGHYIRMASGDEITWLLDAKTGDFLMEGLN